MRVPDCDDGKTLEGDYKEEDPAIDGDKCDERVDESPCHVLGSKDAEVEQSEAHFYGPFVQGVKKVANVGGHEENREGSRWDIFHVSASAIAGLERGDGSVGNV